MGLPLACGVSRRMAIALLAGAALVSILAISISHFSDGTQFEELQGFVFPAFRFPPMRMNMGGSHDRMSSDPGFKMVSSSHAFDIGGRKPKIIEHEVIERPGPNGTIIKKVYNFQDSGRKESASSGGSKPHVEVLTFAPLTKKQIRAEKRAEKRERKQEKRMEKGMEKMAKSIFSNFFGGGRGRHNMIIIPRQDVVGRMRPRREWQKTKSKSAAKSARKPAAKPKAPPKGPVVKHGVVNGLAAAGTLRQKLATIADWGQPDQS